MKSILVIDDQKEILNLVRLALSMRGFFVEIALNGIEGIKKYNGRNFDLVITKINMPKQSGNEVCEHIRNSNSPDTLVIGMLNPPYPLSGNQFDKIIKKPFSFKRFLDQVQHLIQGKSEQNDIAANS